jgi:hypothetical protein
MRKRLIAALAAVAVLAAVATAYAANVYEVDIATVTPKGKGTPAKPLPARFAFGYEVSDSNPANRPSPLRQYRIAAEGVFAYPKPFNACRFTDTDEVSDVSSKCNKARLGGGTVTNNAGPRQDLTAKLPCKLNLRLYNISDAGRNGGLSLRLDGDPPDCPLSVHTAIKAPFTTVKVDGVKTSELRFSVPDNLAHPAGLDNAVVDTTAVLERKTARMMIKGVRRTVGFYSEIGCKGKRSVRVQFVDETGQRFTANKDAAC